MYENPRFLLKKMAEQCKIMNKRYTVANFEQTTKNTLKNLKTLLPNRLEYVFGIFKKKTVIACP